MALSIAAVVGENSVCEMDVNKNALRTELCGEILLVSAGSVALTNTPGLVSPPLAECLEAHIESS